jgi:sugar phosphate isomerase/epimerase
MNLSLQCWSFRKFTFFETLEKAKELEIKYLQIYPGQKLSSETEDVKTNHNLTPEQIQLVKKKLTEYDLKLVSYGVVGFDNDEASMRQVFDFAKAFGIQTIVTEPKYDDFSLIEKMVQEYDIQIAIHNHPLPSKYARPDTVLKAVKGLDPRIGSCADTGHWMRTGVDPVEALKMLEGRILDVHLKDLEEFGVHETKDVPFGQGKGKIREVLEELTRQNYHGYLAIEYENQKESMNPSPSIQKGIEYIQSITYYQDYQELLKFNMGRYSRNGWNHYGPGYFILDEKNGILQSRGGMGLYWFAEKMFKNFILELEFKCSDPGTNSGVFLRVPGIPVNDDYIYHSFEIQIDNMAEKDIHQTGAVYDAEPPSEKAFKEVGEWNHFKIAFIDNHIRVELNGVQVIDWKAESQGKVKDFAQEGYIGLQNHNTNTTVYFRKIYIKEL